jgi:hypothetical protein
MSSRWWAFVIVFAMNATVVSAGIVFNGDFQTGDLTGWSVFTTSNGSNGEGLPNVVSFDTLNDGSPSLAAHFAVGEIDTTHFGTSADNAGGGLSQTIFLSPGTYIFSVAFAGVNDDSVAGQAELGVFTLLLDGSALQTVDLGYAGPSQELFGSFDVTVPVTNGPSHSLAVQITRPYGGGVGVAEEYLDDISVSAVPEAGSLALLLSGASALVAMRRRRFYDRDHPMLY